MRMLTTIADYYETNHAVSGTWKCGHTGKIDLGRVMLSGLGDLPGRALRALRCPICGHRGPAETRLHGPISDHIRAEAAHNAKERTVKVVPIKPKR